MRYNIDLLEAAVRIVGVEVKRTSSARRESAILFLRNVLSDGFRK